MDSDKKQETQSDLKLKRDTCDKRHATFFLKRTPNATEATVETATEATATTFVTQHNNLKGNIC